MDLPEAPSPAVLPTHEVRNSAILRRTLSAISWIYAFWSGLFALLALAAPQHTRGLYDGRVILLHAALLGAAGAWQWKPRRGWGGLTLLAALGSVYFLVLDLRQGSLQTALIDGFYAPLAAVLAFKSRRLA